MSFSLISCVNSLIEWWVGKFLLKISRKIAPNFWKNSGGIFPSTAQEKRDSKTGKCFKLLSCKFAESHSTKRSSHVLGPIWKSVNLTCMIYMRMPHGYAVGAITNFFWIFRKNSVKIVKKISLLKRCNPNWAHCHTSIAKCLYCTCNVNGCKWGIGGFYLWYQRHCLHQHIV